jgi:hypothetical protein
MLLRRRLNVFERLAARCAGGAAVAGAATADAADARTIKDKNLRITTAYKIPLRLA